MNAKSALNRVTVAYVVIGVAFLGLALAADGKQRVLFTLWVPLLLVLWILQRRRIRKLQHDHERKYGHNEPQ